jgi:predicted solute-binding protein
VRVSRETDVSPWTVLRALRIGCVQYLNARPLIHAYDGVVSLDHPSMLATKMATRELDAGLVPIFEALRAGDYQVVDAVAIACDGPVFSVFLAHDRPLAEVRRICLDPASASSVHLLKVLLAEFHGLRPEYSTGLEADAADARLLIGNQAIQFRREHQETHQFLDLGAEWKRCTGLPFVFAVWLLQRDLADPSGVADAFRALRVAGLARLREIITTEEFQDESFRAAYLGGHIRYGLGLAEKQGIAKFRELLVKHGFVQRETPELAFC